MSLPDDDVAFLDDYARTHARSRSAAVHAAIVTLRDGTLADAYAQAFGEWEQAGEGELWGQASGDGLE
ncbi:MAG: antitoxin [Solirubrobacteraceae bacterium]